MGKIQNAAQTTSARTTPLAAANGSERLAQAVGAAVGAQGARDALVAPGHARAARRQHLPVHGCAAVVKGRVRPSSEEDRDGAARGLAGSVRDAGGEDGKGQRDKRG